MVTFTNWMQPQPNGPPGGTAFNGGQMGQQPGQAGAAAGYYGTGMRDSPTSAAMGIAPATAFQGQAFNGGMVNRPAPSPTAPQQPFSGGNQQYSPMAPAPGGPPMGGGNQVYSPMAPAQMPPQQYSPMAPAPSPPQQYSPMAPSPSLPPTGGAAMTSPRQNLRPLQFNGRAGGMFGFGGGR